MEFEVRERPFMRGPVASDLTQVKTPYAFVGMPFGVPYTVADLAAAADGADAVRAASWDTGWAFNWNNMNFDTGRAIFPHGDPYVTDCGNITVPLSAPEEIWDTGMQRLAELVGTGAIPFVVGGLDSIPPIVVGAFAEQGTVYNVLHIDAHLDFRQERYGVSRGFSSPIRRIREFGFVNEIVQVGLRSMGSARMSDVAEATASGNRIVTAHELRKQGPEAFLDSLSDEHPWLLSIDVDGLDPTIAPAVAASVSGGIDFYEMSTIMQGLGRRGSIAGAVFTEFQPRLDPDQVTARTIGRLILIAMDAQAE